MPLFENTANRKEQLQWLRTASVAELAGILFQQLEKMAKSTSLSAAELRLLGRELMDRDDADGLSELIAEIRATIKAVESKPRAKQNRDPRQ